MKNFRCEYLFRLSILLRMVLGVCVLQLYPLFSLAAQPAGEPDLTELSIEELLQQKVISVSKTEQAFADTAAAVFVISQDDLRRSGVTSVPEALRMAPGLEVARIDSSKWAITARGFNGRFANKLLMLMDGRTVYTPTFSGIYWETQDLLLEDIERIEIIRGPGASTWGANAVNGIINIITKNAADTQDKLVSLTVGNEEKMIASARYSATLTENGYFRMYAKHLKRDGMLDEQQQDAGDQWDMTRTGFRMDLTPSTDDTLMVQGDMYMSNLDQNYTVPTVTTSSGGQRILKTGDAHGGSLLMRWERVPSLSSRVAVQFAYDNFRRNDTFQNEKRDTYELDFQHDIALSQKQEFSWGLGYRLSSDDVKDTPLVSIPIAQRNLQLFSTFLQDRIRFLEDRMELTLGTKVEHHTFGGWQLQPNLRGIWNLGRSHRLWASISRATRTPSRGETDAQVNFLGMPQINSIVVLEGSPNFRPEKVLSYELGYRSWPTNNLYFDLSTFYNQYDDLIIARPMAPIIEPGKVTKIPLLAINGEQAKTWGVELAADWRPNLWWRLQLAYTYLRTHFKRKYEIDNNTSSFFPLGDRRAPEKQISLRSSFNLSQAVELDFWVRYVDDIPDITVINAANLPRIKRYLTLDAKFAWRPRHGLELSLVGRNLNNAHHFESLQEIGTYPTQIQRSIYGQIKWQF